MVKKIKYTLVQAAVLLGSQALAVLNHKKRLALLPGHCLPLRKMEPQTPLPRLTHDTPWLGKQNWFARNVWFLGSPFAAAVTLAGFTLYKVVEWRAEWALETTLGEAHCEPTSFPSSSPLPQLLALPGGELGAGISGGV